MKFLVDECTGSFVARWLREQGYQVLSVYDEMRGAEDDFLLEKAYTEGWILVTNDKDFGEKVVREGRQHSGVILLRLKDERTANKIRVLKQLLDRYAGDLKGNLVIATETTVRIIRFHK